MPAWLKITQSELYKIFKKGRSYIGFAAIAFIVIVIQVALYADGKTYLEIGTQALQESFAFEGNLLNGYLSVYIILTSLWVHIPFLIALVAGDLLSGEATAGTFRILLTRPISRQSIVIGKFVAMVIYVLTLILFMAILSLGAGLLIFGPGDLFVIKDIIYVFAQDDSLWRIMAAFGFSFLSMTTVAALAFMFSSLVDSSLGPIIMTMSIIIVFMIISSIDLSFFKAIKPFLFTTHMGSWQEFFKDPVDYHKLQSATIVLATHILIFMNITLQNFKRKDILT
jgi:ABC-2 type transport system permease protein